MVAAHACAHFGHACPALRRQQRAYGVGDEFGLLLRHHVAARVRAQMEPVGLRAGGLAQRREPGCFERVAERPGGRTRRPWAITVSGRSGAR